MISIIYTFFGLTSMLVLTIDKPDQIVKSALKNQVHILGLSDHDSVRRKWAKRIKNDSLSLNQQLFNFL